VTSPLDRRARYDLAEIGDALGEPSRAAMVVALMGGIALPASELARVAGVAPSTASTHLRRLIDAGLLVGRTQGRHRYFSLAGPEVAEAVERLAMLGVRPASSRRGPPDEALAVARTCYGHLAGRVAVAFWTHATKEDWVRWDDTAVILAPRGRSVLARAGLLEAELPLGGSACLDWSERVPHVSGRLGRALCGAVLARGWARPVRSTRALRVTPRGEAGLRALGVRWTT
jgi:DNA-binding transcriptional ArsR family regulator